MSDLDLSDESVNDAIAHVTGFQKLLKLNNAEAAHYLDIVIAKAAFSQQEINNLKRERDDCKKALVLERNLSDIQRRIMINR